MYSRKVPTMFVRFWSKSIFFSKYFRKIFKYHISLLFLQWEPRYSVRTERKTDMTKLIVHFFNSANVHKECIYLSTVVMGIA